MTCRGVPPEHGTLRQPAEATGQLSPSAHPSSVTQRVNAGHLRGNRDRCAKVGGSSTDWVADKDQSEPLSLLLQPA